MAEICLSVTADTVAGAITQINEEASWITMAEVRADFLRPDELRQAGELPSSVGIPLIFTLRSRRDGGRYSGSEDLRVRALERAADCGYAYVDLEDGVPLQSAERACERNGVTVIRSRHDFDGVPADLSGWMRKTATGSSCIPKAAVMPRSTADLERLLGVYRQTKDMQKILLGMGEWGFPTRILAGRLGSLVTFCSAGAEAAAPGHVDPETMYRLYRAHNIGPGTQVYCVIGNPVMHSRSPQIHNPALVECAIDGVYVPVPVDDVACFFRLAAELGIRGVSVTVPHKQAVIPMLAETDDAVRIIGSCNTVYRSADGWRGTNSDAPGFLAPLFAESGRTDLQGMRASVIGAGGTACAVVYALQRAGAQVCVFNRTLERGKALADSFGCAHGPLSAEARDTMREYSDIVVQTTSVGMHPHTDTDPAPFLEFDGSEIVYDVIYTPPETVLLRRARERGCKTINGRRMLLEQAYIQFGAFTGREFPEPVRRRLERGTPTG